jgi:hypothetical protein
MRKVFISNRTSHNYDAALKFGEIVSLTKGNMSIEDTSKLYRIMEPILRSSSPNDLILLSGASAINSVAVSIFVALHGKLNLLIYRRNGTYIERNLTLDRRCWCGR